VIVWWIAAAWACDGPERKVVGFDPDGDKVLVRLECQVCSPALELRLLSVPTGALVKRWTILDTADQADAVRGARWKAAEAEITALGVQVDPAIAPVPGPWSGPWGFGTWTVRVVEDKPDAYSTTYTLMASDGAREVALRELAKGNNAANDPNFANAFLVPGGRALLLQDINSCGKRDEIAVTSEEIAAALR
jgi:hypothetical protein